MSLQDCGITPDLLGLDREYYYLLYMATIIFMSSCHMSFMVAEGATYRDSAIEQLGLLEYQQHVMKSFINSLLR